MSGTKESVKRARDLKLVKGLLKRERFNFVIILFEKRLKIFNCWNISFASAKQNVESRK